MHLLRQCCRRNISDITFLMKVAQGIVDSPEFLGSIGLKIPVRTFRKNVLLYVPSVVLIREAIFFYLVVCRYLMASIRMSIVLTSLTVLFATPDSNS